LLAPNRLGPLLLSTKRGDEKPVGKNPPGKVLVSDFGSRVENEKEIPPTNGPDSSSSKKRYMFVASRKVERTGDHNSKRRGRSGKGGRFNREIT